MPPNLSGTKHLGTGVGLHGVRVSGAGGDQKQLNEIKGKWVLDLHYCSGQKQDSIWMLMLLEVDV